MIVCPECGVIGGYHHLSCASGAAGKYRPPSPSRVEEMLHVGGGSFFRITAVVAVSGHRRLTFSTADRRGAVDPNTVVSLNIGGQVDNFTLTNDEAIALMAYLSEVTG